MRKILAPALGALAALALAVGTSSAALAHGKPDQAAGATASGKASPGSGGQVKAQPSGESGDRGAATATGTRHEDCLESETPVAVPPGPGGTKSEGEQGGPEGHGEQPAAVTSPTTEVAGHHAVTPGQVEAGGAPAGEAAVQPGPGGGQVTAEVLGEIDAAPAAGGGAPAAAAPAAAPAALAFTGFDPLPLLAVTLTLALLGSGLVVLGRRRI